MTPGWKKWSWKNIFGKKRRDKRDGSREIERRKINEIYERKRYIIYRRDMKEKDGCI